MKAGLAEGGGRKAATGAYRFYLMACASENCAFANGVGVRNLIDLHGVVFLIALDVIQIDDAAVLVALETPQLLPGLLAWLLSVLIAVFLVNRVDVGDLMC